MRGLCFAVALSLLCMQYCSGECPGGWTAHEGSCYLYFHEKYTFFEAKATCDISRGHLAEITSASENEFIKNMASNNAGDWVWIGLEDFVVEGEYHWATSNDRAIYTNWQSPAEPDDQSHAEDCVILHATNGLWWDYSCEQRCTFVCEQPMMSEEIVG